MHTNTECPASEKSTTINPWKPTREEKNWQEISLEFIYWVCNI